MKDRVSEPHGSYSSIRQCRRRPLRHEFERVLRPPRRSASDAPVLGASANAALAGYLRRLQAGEPVTIGGVPEAFHAAWDRQAGEVGVIAAGRPMLAPIADSRGEYLERPILVVPNLFSRERDGTVDVGEIVAAGRSSSGSDVASSLRPTCYASAVRERTGEQRIFEYVVPAGTEVPEARRIGGIRGAGDFGRSGNIIEAAGRAVDAGSSFPSESHRNCSGCRSSRECREWDGPGSSKSGSESGERGRPRPGEAVACSRR